MPVVRTKPKAKMAKGALPIRVSKKARTESTKKYTYQSFSEKIASIKIDPVRKIQHIGDDEDVESFLRPSLEIWMDKNLTTTFTDFARELIPLTDSLPHIIHYKQDIAGIFYKYIERQDELALEPLLSLLVSFARDLGPDFEPYFGRSLTLLSDIVVKSKDVNVLEWTFNCLAHLLKYLSRLLVNDMKPVFSALSDLLGREYQKPFAVRFAGEAISFLVRKAKTEALLDLFAFITNELDKAVQNNPNTQFIEGVSLMLSESCSGVNNTIHTKGCTVFGAMLRQYCGQENPSVNWATVCENTLVALIHHSTKETFGPIENLIMEFTKERCREDFSRSQLVWLSKLVHIIVAVRKGDRVSNWNQVADILGGVVNILISNTVDIHEVYEVIKAVSAFVQYSEFDSLITKFPKIADRLIGMSPGFLVFSDLVSTSCPSRFRSNIFPYFNKYVSGHWKAEEKHLSLILPDFVARGSLDDRKSASSDSVRLNNGQQWSEELLKRLSSFSSFDDESAVAQIWRDFDVVNIVSKAGKLTSTASKQISLLLAKMMVASGADSSLYPIIGRCMAVFKDEIIFGEDTLEQICSFIPKAGGHPAFLNGLYELIDARVSDRDSSVRILNNTEILGQFSRNLSKSDHSVRLSTLRILNALYTNSKDLRQPIIGLMKEIEEQPLAVSAARETSLMIRRLVALFEGSKSDTFLLRAVPNFLFGLLTVKFAPTWDDAVNALIEISENCEAMVAEIALEWIERGSGTDSKHNAEEPGNLVPSPFRCTNLTEVNDIALKCIERQDAPQRIILRLYNEEIAQQSSAYKMYRSQALRVLIACPAIAEKRSKALVPYILDKKQVDDDVDIEENVDEESSAKRWTRLDRESLLNLFSRFINPKSLFKSEELFKRLLELVASGDDKIQTLALKCILTWKDPALVTYKDNLNSLLDDSRFRDELAKFVQATEEESIILPQHREVLMPVLLRILYGRCIARKSSAANKRGMDARRITILASIANLKSEDQSAFIDIMLGELGKVDFLDKSNPNEYKIKEDTLKEATVTARKQVGYTRMANDMLNQLGSKLRDLLPRLIDALVLTLVKSMRNRIINKSDEKRDLQQKVLRQGTLKAFVSAFTYCAGFNWQPYMRIFFSEAIDNQLADLPAATSQAPSGLLHLFNSWSLSPKTYSLLTDYNNNVIPAIISSITFESVKDEVVTYVLKIVLRIIESGEHESALLSEITSKIIQPFADHILEHLGKFIRGHPKQEVFELAIEVISKIAGVVSHSKESRTILELCAFLLDQPVRRVSPRTKQQLLRIVYGFFVDSELTKEDELSVKLYKQCSALFSYFRDRESRNVLADVFAVFAQRDCSLKEVAQYLKDLNSFSTRRIDEPDFERRLSTYTIINEKSYISITPRQWLPLIHNMLFFVKDEEELAIRTSASFSLRRYVDACRLNQGRDIQAEYLEMLSCIILPALQNGARERSELVRLEVVTVMSHIITELPEWEPTSDMAPLLADKDEEANFFNNILHIQQHRRGRAIRRLGSLSTQHPLSSVNVSKFLLPLLEHYIFDRAEDTHNLANDSINTIGALVERLHWSQYRAVLKRYVDAVIEKQEATDKTPVRLVGAATDALAKAANEKWPKSGSIPEKDEEGDLRLDKAMSPLADSLPSETKFTQDLSGTFLGPLSRYLHSKDENLVTLRVPVSVIIVKVLRLLPDEELKKRLPGVLTDICHILRSRSQDSRDLTRNTLATIAKMLGPQYFSFILKELRGALLRGYQLHVLSYTLHSLLVAVTPDYKPGDLNYCVSDLVSVFIEDIFGVVGSEKDSEDYISRMKEVKSSKSYDSMELLAKITTTTHLTLLVKPVAVLLQEALALKTLRKVDEVLRRLNVGILQNPSLQSRELLTFCYELVREGYKTKLNENEENQIEEGNERTPDLRKRFIVNLKVPRMSATAALSTSHQYKLIRFALDVLKHSLTKYDFLMTPENVDAFVPIIGDALLSYDDEVRISALRLLTAIIKVPLGSIDEGLDVFNQRALAFIKSCPSMTAELAQASLKLLASIIRERRAVRVKETTVAYLLARIKPDLEEPDRQGVCFNFIKAVLARKIVIPEVYDIMDDIRNIMVTNQTRSVRDLARGIYFQFFMDYPTGEGRLDKQLAFLVKNLTYTHASGRQSVLELIHQLLIKVGDKLIQQIVTTFFVPLVMVLINDESSECKEMAGRLLKELLERADKERTQTALNLIISWVGQDEKPLLVRAALQLYGIFFEVKGESALKEVPSAAKHILKNLQKADDEDAQWEQLYFSLQLWAKVVRCYSEYAYSEEASQIWTCVYEKLSYPHAWVKLMAAQLTGLSFGKFAKGDLSSLPLTAEEGLQLGDSQLISIVQRSSAQLNRPDVPQDLGLQTVKNLLFATRVFKASRLPFHLSKQATVDESESEESELDEDEELGASGSKVSALAWVVTRMTRTVRNEKHAKQGISGRTFALQWIAAFAQLCTAEEIEPFAEQLIMPLYTLTEMPLPASLSNLKTTSAEVLQLIQSRMNPTAYAKAHASVREAVLRRRAERRQKRKIELVADPELAAKKKIKKHGKKKEARKEKSKEFRDRRRARNF